MSTGEEVTEAVTGIIMEATGYERDEIDEHMDLRDDLAIRSSRLPIILDAMEHRFGITIDLTDFIHLRTISEISERVAQMVKNGPAASPAIKEMPLPVREDMKRILFSKTPLAEGTPLTFSFNFGDSVCILSMGKRGRFYDRMEKLFQREWGLSTIFQGMPTGLSGLRSRWRTSKGRTKAIGRLKSISSLVGMVLDIRGFPLEQHGSRDGAAGLLAQAFSMVKAATESPTLAFVLLLHDCREDGSGGVLAEGVLGMFLSCAHEYPSVAFRTVGLGHGTDQENAVLSALKEHDPVVERIHENNTAFTMEGSSVPIVYSHASEMGLRGKEVVVFSGGGSGITARLARSLVPLGVRAVLLGRTKIDADRDFSRLLTEDAPVDDAFRRWIDEKHPDISKEDFGKELIRLQKALDVVRTLEDLRARGMDVSYYACDVTRSEEVEGLFETVMAQYGRIDGIVHGAGIIQDGWMRDMTTDDFSSVVQVKISGTLNLFQAARNRGVRFFTCLSSVVSILGNPGQVNYAAANRMMSALVHFLKRDNPSIRFKSLLLPPIEGAGMAENAWIRKIMSERNIGYVHVDELVQIFLREHCLDLSGHSRVMIMRSLSHMNSVRLNEAVSSPGPEKISVAGLIFRRRDFPMIDSISQVDLQRGSLIAHRSFSHEKDAWLNDHRPLKSMKHPVVSGIMLIETLMEAARMLYPYLRPRKILNAWFLDMIECPLGTVRSSRILCRRVASKDGQITCEVSLETGSVSSEKPGRTAGVVCRVEVIMGNEDETLGEKSDRVYVRMDELDTPRVDVGGFLDHYERHSDLQGRYRMEMSLDGTGPRVVVGRMAYGEGSDFFHLENAHYQYSPYLLEMLFHLPRFHGAVRDAAGSGNLVPAGIEEMAWFRKCRMGENVSSFARMKNKTRGGSLWDITAFDENEEPLMVVKGLRMQKAPE
jgi:NAD(P)-dependent dehydrogenase (short-subunit alcohol dehydrogenase family)/acyl carrier protein